MNSRYLRCDLESTPLDILVDRGHAHVEVYLYVDTAIQKVILFSDLEGLHKKIHAVINVLVAIL